MVACIDEQGQAQCERTSARGRHQTKRHIGRVRAVFHPDALFDDERFVDAESPDRQTAFERKRLDALRPHLPGGAWESLLAAIRAHLERQIPLDVEVCVQLADGRLEWWRVQGVAEHNAGGQPVYLSGNVRDVSAKRRRDAGGEEP